MPLPKFPLQLSCSPRMCFNISLEPPFLQAEEPQLWVLREFCYHVWREWVPFAGQLQSVVPCPCRPGCLSWGEGFLCWALRVCSMAVPSCPQAMTLLVFLNWKLQVTGSTAASLGISSSLEKDFLGTKALIALFLLFVVLIFFLLLPANNLGFLFTVLSVFKEAGEIMVSLFF